MKPKPFINFKAEVVHDHEKVFVRVSGYLGGEIFSQRDGETPIQIRIFRKQEPGFIFNQHYKEYFDGLQVSDAEIVYEGYLPLKNRRKFTFEDLHVEAGMTYCYWGMLLDDTKEKSGGTNGPAFVKVRDARVWWPFEEMQNRLAQLADKQHCLVELQSYGESTGHRPLQGIRIGNRERCIALIGAIHAGESGPELLIPVLERLASEETELLNSVGIAVLPSANPDERERQVKGTPWYLRTNANGVDLNRNFPAGWEVIDESYGLDSSDPDALTYRGPYPASEGETQAMMRFIKTARPVAVFTTHCLAGICAPVFLTSRFASDDAAFNERCEQLTSAYTSGYYGDSRAPVVKHACSSGSLTHWMYEEWGVPSFDLEWDKDEATRPCLTDGTTVAMVKECAEKHYRGILAVLRGLAKE